MLVLMIGLVAVAQLVPMSVRLNSGNRDDSTAMAFAQRELDAMIEQPIGASRSPTRMEFIAPRWPSATWVIPRSPRCSSAVPS